MKVDALFREKMNLNVYAFVYWSRNMNMNAFNFSVNVSDADYMRPMEIVTFMFPKNCLRPRSTIRPDLVLIHNLQFQNIFLKMFFYKKTNIKSIVRVCYILPNLALY